MPRRSARRSVSRKSYIEPQEKDIFRNDDKKDDDAVDKINGDHEGNSKGTPKNKKRKASAIAKRKIDEPITIQSDDDDEDLNEDTNSKDGSKSKLDGSDNVNDNDDSDNSSIAPKPKRRKRGRPLGSKTNINPASSGKGKTTKERNYGSLAERTCPFCSKVFSIVTGLAYHIEHRVCQKDPKKAFRARLIGSTPNSILLHNSNSQGTPKSGGATNADSADANTLLNPCFVTPYGIVRVVKDDRAGSDYGTTVLNENIKVLRKKYCRKLERVEVRKENVYAFVAKRSRRKRERLLNYYNDMSQKDDRANAGMQTDTSMKSVEERKKEYASAVFKEYYTLSTSTEILSGVFHKSREPPLLPVLIENRTDVPDDPAVPKDSYPDRMVECELIPDERKVIMDLDDSGGGDGMGVVDAAFALVEQTKRDFKRGRKKQAKAAATNGNLNGNDGHLNTAAAAGSEESTGNTASIQKRGGMTLFLQRKLLVEEYNPSLKVYCCKKCGTKFNSRSKFKTHVKNKACIAEGKNFAQKRLNKLEEAEEALELEELKTPSWLLPPLKAEPGGKKRKRSNKLPGWIVFDPELSSVYPVVFKHLKLKRGSNNSKFMLKKWDAIGGPGRKKTARKSRAKRNSVNSVVNQVSQWIDIGNATMYPGVMAALFPENAAPQQESGSQSETRRTGRRAASKKALEKVLAFTNVDSSDGRVVKDEEDYNPDADGGNFNADDDDFLPGDDAAMPPLPMPSLPLPSIETLQMREPVTKSKDMPPMNDEPAAHIQNNTRTNNETRIGNEISEGEKKPPPKKRRKRKKSDAPLPIKPAGPIIVDTRPLVEEVRAGRYPSMKVYNGEHLNICFSCKTKSDDVFHCEFCANSEHMGCLKSKITILDLGPDDEFMCHRCIQTVLARRARAERRRLEKLNEAKTAAGSSAGLALEQAKNAAALKREVIWSQSEFDQHVSSYSKCPTGGPGGLICCGPCTSSYSRLLSETAKEMEVQTLSGVGREVSELIELLHDAQNRLKQALDVSNGNSIKRSMLSRDQIGEDDAKGAFAVSSTSLMGIMDIFGNK